MARTAQLKKIKPFEAWTAVIDPDLLGSSRTVEKNMDGNVQKETPHAVESTAWQPAARAVRALEAAGDPIGESTVDLSPRVSL